MPQPDPHAKGLVLRFLREHVRPWWGLQLLIGLCLVIGVLLELADPLLLKGIVDGALANGDRGLLFGLTGLLCVILVFRVAFRLLSVALYSYGGLRILFELRQRLFEHVQKLSPLALRGERMGDVLARVTADIDVLQRAAAHSVVNAFHDVLLIVGILAILVALDPVLALTFLIAYPLLALVLLVVNGRIRRAGMDARVAVGGLYDFLEERLGSIRLVQEFQRERASARDHVRVSRPWIRNNLRLSVLAAGQTSLADIMAMVGLLLVFLVGGLRAMEGDLSLGTLIAFYVLSTRLFRPISGLIDVNVDLQVARASLARVYEYLDREPEIRDDPQGFEAAAIRGAVVVKGASFAWPGAEETLKDVALAIDPGQVVAFVGPSGSGKSTLAALLTRELDVTAGGVEIEGVDTRRWRLGSLRRHVGLVPQEVRLLHASVRDNLGFAQRGVREDELRRVLDVAELGDWISELPGGLDTQVGQAGARFSGGERQRLALARALLKDPSILILDEATSALDARTERRLLSNLMVERRGRTLILIAHRLTSLVGVDRIFVFDRGRLVEAGSHAELYGRDGLYRNLFDQQGEPAIGPRMGLPG